MKIQPTSQICCCFAKTSQLFFQMAILLSYLSKCNLFGTSWKNFPMFWIQQNIKPHQKSKTMYVYTKLQYTHDLKKKIFLVCLMPHMIPFFFFLLPEIVSQVLWAQARGLWNPNLMPSSLWHHPAVSGAWTTGPQPLDDPLRLAQASFIFFHMS